MTEIAPTPPQDPRYIYQKTSPSGITVQQLDDLMAFVMNSPKTTWGAIIAGIKMLVITVYLIARDKLESAMMEATKQQNEQAQAGKDQNAIDHDDLSGQRKNS